MPWTCRLVESEPQSRPLEIGDMRFAPWLVGHACLSPKYLRDWKDKRMPLTVRLPSGFDFCVDSMFWKGGQNYGEGWTVTGEAPLLTLSPSINIVGSYHGFLQNGVLSDDVEGRTFWTEKPCI